MVTPIGTLGYVGGSGGGPLRQPLQTWVYQHPSWQKRFSDAEGRWRQSQAGEVAAELVEDPKLQAVLAGLDSPIGRAIEEAVLSQWMGAGEAQLMTAALNRAWKIIRNRNVPAWKRGEVLVGTAVALMVALTLVLAVRAHSQGKAKESTNERSKGHSTKKGNSNA
jgi:hypothetical protein